MPTATLEHADSVAALAEPTFDHPGSLPWLEALRRAGANRFKAVGFPKQAEEAWRFTNLAPITRSRFKPADHEVSADARELVSKFTFGDAAIVELVFVNGYFVAKLSKLAKLPRGVRVGSISEALGDDAELLHKHLGKYADIHANPFVALNTAHIRDGVFIHVAKGVAIEQPVHLLYVTTNPGEEPMIVHARMLVIAEEASQLTLVKSYVGNGKYLTNGVTEVVAAQGAIVDHNRLQQESPDAFHISTTQARLERDANYINHNANLGALLARNDINVVLAGEHAHATLNGLVLISGTQHVDNHTLLRHDAPNCPSHEMYKHVLDGKSTAVFKGQIYVNQIAQKTDSKQSSRTLLLSEDANMQSMPALEIYADDVKCTHGSTIGPVDDDAVFYLRSRGIDRDAARHLLTYAFAADITRRIKVEPVRRRLEDFMAARSGLPQDLRITDLGAHDDAHR